MSGKQAKRERRRQREAARAAARRRERQRTVFTLIVIAVLVAVGGVLVFLSLERPAADVADSPTDAAASDAASAAPTEPVEPCTPAAPGKRDTAEKPTFDQPEQVLEEGSDYRAVIATSCGRVVVALDAERAPETVNSFVFLAQEGFFNGLEIFRSAPSIGVLQTGAGDNANTWDIGYELPDELEAAEAEGYPPGAVAMANSGPNTAGSQFFFVVNDRFTLEPTYTKFGQVVEGLDVLQSIAAIPVGGESGEEPTETVVMNRVRIQSGDFAEPTPPSAPTAAPLPSGVPSEPSAPVTPPAGS